MEHKKNVSCVELNALSPEGV